MNIVTMCTSRYVYTCAIYKSLHIIRCMHHSFVGIFRQKSCFMYIIPVYVHVWYDIISQLVIRHRAINMYSTLFWYDIVWVYMVHMVYIARACLRFGRNKYTV